MTADDEIKNLGYKKVYEDKYEVVYNHKKRKTDWFSITKKTMYLEPSGARISYELLLAIKLKMEEFLNDSR